MKTSGGSSSIPWQDEKLIQIIAVSELGGDSKTLYGLDLIGWPKEPHRDGTWDDPGAALENSAATEIDEAASRYGVDHSEVWNLFTKKYESQIKKEMDRFIPKSADIKKAEAWFRRAGVK